MWERGNSGTFSRKLETDGRSFTFLDLPAAVREAVEAKIKNSHLPGLGADLVTELRRCFDLESVSNMIRLSDHSNEMRISLDVSEGGKDLWNFRMGIGGSDTDAVTDGQIEDMVLLPEGGTDSVLWSNEILIRLQHLVREEEEAHKSSIKNWPLSTHRAGGVFEEIIHKAAG